MIKDKTAADLQAIAMHGGSLVVEAQHYTAQELQQIAQRLKNGSHLHVANSQHLTTADCQAIARQTRDGATAIFS